MANHATLYVFATRQIIKTNNTSSIIEDDDYAFRMQYETYSYKWIMNSEATKYMTFHKMTFDTYEVLSSFNVHLDDDSIVEAMITKSIIVEVLVIGNIKGIWIKYVIYVPKLSANLLSVSKFLSNGF